MSNPNKAHLSMMGQKGGKASGECKRRPADHYKMLALIRAVNRLKRKISKDKHHE